MCCARLTITEFDDTVAYVHDFMVKNGPFDGIMGFSQGACMSAIIGALVSCASCHLLLTVPSSSSPDSTPTGLPSLPCQRSSVR